jgi:hypothetical protein
LNLGLTPTTTEGLLSTVEVHNNNLEGEGKEIPEDVFEQSTKERSLTSSSSFSNNDDDKSPSTSNNDTAPSFSPSNDAALGSNHSNKAVECSSPTNDAAKSKAVAEKCSYRRCMDKFNQNDLVDCAVATCSKIIHGLCFQHHVVTNLDFTMQSGVVCCAAKACCAKFKLGNQDASTCWDSDGPNGPNSVPNSESLLVDCWSMGDNWSM